jgi:hypothetical protein
MWGSLDQHLNGKYSIRVGPPYTSETNSKVQAFWVATRCQATPRHHVLCTPAAVFKNPSCLVCKVCNVHTVATIQGLCRTIDKVHEPILWGLLHSKFPGTVWVVQCKPIKGWRGSVDVAIFGPSRKFVVQVDGSSHTRERRRLRTTLQQQRAIDKRCNTEAHKQGVGVLRLHVADGHQWLPLLRSAVDACLGAAPGMPWPCYAATTSIICEPPGRV